jgi:hypothetical protein
MTDTLSRCCAKCGQLPCVNPSFCRVCRIEAPKPRSRRNPRIPVNWQEMSLGALYQHFNKTRPTTPQTTIEAILHCVRERGLAALKEPANIERLARCDAAPQAEISRRIAKLKKGSAP